MGGGGTGRPNSQQAHDVVLTSMRRNDVALTSFRRHVPTRFFINQNNYILILKTDNIENSRIELKGIVLQVPSNQIKVSFIIIIITKGVPKLTADFWFCSARACMHCNVYNLCRRGLANVVRTCNQSICL